MQAGIVRQCCRRPRHPRQSAGSSQRRTTGWRPGSLHSPHVSPQGMDGLLPVPHGDGVAAQGRIQPTCPRHSSATRQASNSRRSFIPSSQRSHLRQRSRCLPSKERPSPSPCATAAFAASSSRVSLWRSVSSPLAGTLPTSESFLSSSAMVRGAGKATPKPRRNVSPPSQHMGDTIVTDLATILSLLNPQASKS